MELPDGEYDAPFRAADTILKGEDTDKRVLNMTGVWREYLHHACKLTSHEERFAGP